MFKTQVEQRAVGESFHCQVLNVLLALFSLPKSQSCCNNVGRSCAITENSQLSHLSAYEVETKIRSAYLGLSK